MSISKTFIGVTAVLLVLVGVIFFAFNDRQQEVGLHYTSDIKIEQTWKLPEVLEEVSGIAYMGEGRMLCIQDEDGTIFIYNLNSSEIEEEIEFSGGGDYEGIALNSTTVYVLESNGTIYRVSNFNSDPRVTEHETFLTEDEDVEGLSFDPENNRLLLAIKEKEPESSDFKGVYAVDPQTMQMQQEPLFRLLFRDPVFENVDEKDQHDTFRPSEINIHPITGEFYMLEGVNPKLLILDSNGKPDKLRFLNENDFPQPEGITFDEAGNTYISNEGNPATIHLISIEK